MSNDTKEPAGREVTPDATRKKLKGIVKDNQAKIDKITGVKASKQTNYKQTFFQISGIVVTLLVAALAILAFSTLPQGAVALEILQSQFMLALIGGVAAPWLAQTARDKVGIEIEAKDITELITGVSRAADLTRREVSELRDEDGKLSDEDKALAKQIALLKLKDTFGEEKYLKMAKKVGYEYIDKKIDEYVKSDWQKRYPIEKEQVKELVRFAAEAFPDLKKWNDLDPNRKKELLDGSLKPILSSAGIEGWGGKVLELYLSAEHNKPGILSNCSEVAEQER